MSFDWGTALQGGTTGGAVGGPWGAAAGGILGGLFGGGKNPTKEANKYFDQIPAELRQYLMPYINAGQGALNNLHGLSSEYEKMYQDPNAIISRLGGGYRQSPGYQWRLNQGENSINNAAAAGGMAGTAQHQQQAGELAGNLADQDYQNYLNSALGIYGGGLSGRTGLEQNIFNTGANASGSLAASIANALMGQGSLAYGGAANKNQSNSDFLSSILGYFSKK